MSPKPLRCHLSLSLGQELHRPGRLYAGLAFMVCCLLCTSPVQAYFHVPQNLPVSEYTLDPAENPLPLDRQYLALYPDLRALADQKAELCPCFAPWSPHVSPALRISLSRPLILTRHNLATTLELSLKNLLYADIKLSKLVQEYKQLRDRSRELISSHPKAEQSEGSGSIQERRKSLMRWKQLETRRIIALLESTQALDDVDQDLLQDIQSIDEKRLKIRSLKAGNGQNQTSPSASTGAANKDQSVTKAQDRGLCIQPYASDSGLPWLFQDILFLLNLVMTYKIETALIGMSLVFLGAILGRARRR